MGWSCHLLIRLSPFFRPFLIWVLPWGFTSVENKPLGVQILNIIDLIRWPKDIPLVIKHFSCSVYTVNAFSLVLYNILDTVNKMGPDKQDCLKPDFNAIVYSFESLWLRKPFNIVINIKRHAHWQKGNFYEEPYKAGTLQVWLYTQLKEYQETQAMH